MVLDTNILLHHLKYMDELKDENFEGWCDIIVHLNMILFKFHPKSLGYPWMLFQEKRPYPCLEM